MKIAPSKAVAACLMILSVAGSQAATVNLSSSDGVGTTSYNQAGHWANGQAPVGTNDYNTAGFFMRTPGDGTTNDVFAGASLTLGIQNTVGGNNGSMLEKFSGGAGSSRWLTINNFTNTSGALLRSGGTAGALIHIQGNHYAIAGTSAINADQCIWVIDCPLLGADNVILTNFANNANDHIAYTGTNSGFTGSWYLTGAGNSAWSTELDSVFSLPGNPSSFNPGQITFLGTGQLRDTVGCSITNSNGGITLAANGNINAAAITLIGEQITDQTNGVPSVSSLTSSGTGTLILSNANNNYTGGTTISAGILQLGTTASIPVGLLTDNGTLDLNTFNETIDGLAGSGAVETAAGGTPTLTIGANGGSATFSGTINGTLSVLKTGAGTETFSGGYSYSGATIVAGGTLSVPTAQALPSPAGDVVVSNSAALAVNVGQGVALPANNLVLGNSTLSFTYGALGGNPTVPAINAAGGISAPGSSIVINISALGLRPGTFTLIKYTGAALGSLANFSLNLPPGVFGTLVNNTGNDSIDINLTATPNQLSWYGTGGGSWDLTTANWSNYIAGGTTVFQQYTNGGLVAGDSITFDDTLTNDLINPQPTNITLNTTFFAFPVFFNSSLPYSISGTGGITGTTSLVVSNTGSVTLLTSNSFTGGVSANGGSLIITNDNALGTNNSLLTLNGALLQINGSTTNTARPISMPVETTIGVGSGSSARFGGRVTGVTLDKTGLGTLVLGGTNIYSGNLFIHAGTLVIDSGVVTNSNYDDVGQNTTDNSTLTMRGTGSLGTSSDFNVGDIDSSTGTLNIQDTASMRVNAFFVASANAAGSTASGTVNQTGGTLTEVATAIGNFVIGGRVTGASGVGVYNLSGGTVNANGNVRLGSGGVGTLNQSGGTFNAILGVNIARLTGGIGTNNLNGGTLATFNLTSSQGTNAVINFNGGTLQAQFAPANPWFFGGIQANILAGGAFIDSSSNNAVVTTPLLAGSPNGGLTKSGSGMLTLSGTNTFTGPITNNAGTLFLNSGSTYPGAVQVNAGILQISPAPQLTGPIVISNKAIFSVVQNSNLTATAGNLTFNGAAGVPGATLSATLTTANIGTVPFINAGTVTLNGTNTISLTGAIPLGPTAVLKYTGALAGSGNITNLILPQGASGYISNNAPSSTLYVVVTNAGPGLVWTGTNNAAGRTNLWDILTTTNWLVNGAPTWYQQFSIPGDAVTFNDTGSGTVLLSNNVAPASVTISNNAKSYTFSGNGTITGTTGLTKLGAGTAIVNLTNNTYIGNTVVSNGILQLGSSAAVAPNSTVVLGPTGTLEVNGFNQTISELTGAGILDNTNGNPMTITIGAGTGGTWAGTVQDHGGGIALIRNGGSSTWFVSGTNNLNNGTAFTIQNQINSGTVVLTNGGTMISSTLEFQIGNGGNTAAMVVANGSVLAVSNNLLTLGTNNGNGTLTVNGGTVIHSGNPGNAFGQNNNIEVGGLANGRGTLIVNGGQVLNSQALTIAQGSGSSGMFFLNGGLVQATIVQTGSATTASNFFNGGTLQATTNSGDFIQVASMVMSNGLVLDDGGFTVSILTAGLQSGDAFNGGLIKKGAGTLYLDAPGNSYTGTTLVNNGTLGGSSSIAGPLVVSPAGNVAPGDAGPSAGNTFTIGGNLTLQGSATFRVSVNGGSAVADEIVNIAAANYGGTLVVSNVTSDSTAMTNGQSFQLFAASSGVGNFANIVGSPGAGLSYVFHPDTGVLSVTNVVVKSVPHFTTIHLSGTTLTIAGTNGTPGGQYVLLGSTNVTKPLAQWTPLLTNSFDGSGNFNLSTNIVIPGVPIEFYLLSQ
jgi:autotransporter-associated beta strand protein